MISQYTSKHRSVKATWTCNICHAIVEHFNKNREMTDNQRVHYEINGHLLDVPHELSDIKIHEVGTPR